MASKCYLLITPITLLLLIPSVGAIAVYGYATINKRQEERHPSPKRDGGASTTRSSSPRPSLSPAAPELAPRPGPSRHRCRPSLPSARAEPHPPCLVPSGLNTRPPHPCQELREPPCPPPRLPPTATTTLTTSAASTPRWTRCLRTTGRGPPSPRRCHPYRPQWGGGVQNTAPCRSQNHAATLAGTSARSSLVVVIVGGGLAGRKRRWWRLPGAEAAAEEAAAAVIIW
jgi:hypothetical protein